MGEERNVNDIDPFEFIMQVINPLNIDEMRIMIEFGFEVVMNPLMALFEDMEDEDIPIDEPEPVEPAVVMEQEVPPEDPPQIFRIFVTKNYGYHEIFIVEIQNPLYHLNDPYIFRE